MAIKINIDVAKLAADLKEFALEAEQDLMKGVASLAAMTHAKVAEMASEELSSSLSKLQESLEFEEIMPGIWAVSIDENGLWIEEGIESGKDMKPDLLKNATKVSQKGFKYRAIPFEHSQPASKMTPYAQSLVSRIKKKLKEKDIPFKKIEKNPDGSPRVGRLHEFDIDSEKPTARASHPALHNVSIYQTVTPTGNVRRDILTFRNVSESPASAGKWIHPGYKARKFLDRSLEWALNEWEKNILPEILSKYNSR